MIVLGEVARIRNPSGYILHTWNTALSQLLGIKVLVDTLLGNSHPAVTDYDRFLRRYSQMPTRLEFEIDHEHGRRLYPSLMTFHVRLLFWNWMMV
jgi:pyruvate/oxaloacetate carboxyltransferase